MLENMNFLRKHWYDIALGLALIVLISVSIFNSKLTHYQHLMWLSLVSLFLHQTEEYKVVGTFPGMINKVLFKSDMPDRYPLNTNSALCVNVFFGWSVYFLAAATGEKAIWLGMATMLISFGNVAGHTFLFNIKGKTLYNAGMATALLFFIPCIFFFFKIIHGEHLVTLTDYLIGIPIGIVFNVVGVFKLIAWLADKNTSYIFEERNLLPADRGESQVTQGRQ